MQLGASDGLKKDAGHLNGIIFGLREDLFIVCSTAYKLCFYLACEQAPKWGIGRRQKSAGLDTWIFDSAFYPTWEPVERLVFIAQNYLV